MRFRIYGFTVSQSTSICELNGTRAMRIRPLHYKSSLLHRVVKELVKNPELCTRNPQTLKTEPWDKSCSAQPLNREGQSISVRVASQKIGMTCLSMLRGCTHASQRWALTAGLVDTVGESSFAERRFASQVVRCASLNCPVLLISWVYNPP